MDSTTDPQEINYSSISGGTIAFNTSTADHDSGFMSNLVRSNSDQIELHQKNENANLDRRSQEVTSTTVPPGFKAAAAAAATAAMTSLKPYVANLNRNSTATVASCSTPSVMSTEITMGRVCRPSATLHYKPPRDGPPPQAQHCAQNILQQQPQHGPLPRQPPPRQPPTPNAALTMVNQRTGHNLPIAVMPSQQQFQIQTIKQWRANDGQLQEQQSNNAIHYAPVHATGTGVQVGLVSPVQPPNARALPPMLPLMCHLYSLQTMQRQEIGAQ